MPPVISHGNNRTRPGYTPFQDRFDWPATFDPTAWFCVGDAIEWMGRLLPGGWKELRQRNHDLVVAARKLLCDRLELEAPFKAARSSPRHRASWTSRSAIDDVPSSTMSSVVRANAYSALIANRSSEARRWNPQ